MVLVSWERTRSSSRESVKTSSAWDASRRVLIGGDVTAITVGAAVDEAGILGEVVQRESLKKTKVRAVAAQSTLVKSF